MRLFISNPLEEVSISKLAAVRSRTAFWPAEVAKVVVGATDVDAAVAVAVAMPAGESK